MQNRGFRINYVPPAEERTDVLYVPHNVAIEELDDAALVRGLCFKSSGRVAVCRGCQGCAFGRELTRRRENA